MPFSPVGPAESQDRLCATDAKVPKTVEKLGLAGI